MMKVFILLYLSLVLHEYACWTDEKSQAVVPNDPLMRMLNFLYTNGKDKSKFDIENLRKIFVKFEDALLKHLEKWRKKHGEHVVKDMLNFITKDNKTLSKDLKAIMKNIPDNHHGKFMRRLKKFLGSLSHRKVENMAKYKLRHASILPTKDIEARKIKRRKQHWAEILKSGGGMISKAGGNVLDNLKEVAPGANKTSKGEQVIENWIGKHFTKPHHLSTDDEISPRDLEVLQSINLAMEQTASDREIQDDLDRNEIGKALLKGLLSERNVLPWASNASLAQMSAEAKEKYLQAESRWETRLTQETQRLLEKLHPAEAYIIPDLQEHNQLRKAKKLKRLNTNRKIKKMIAAAKRSGQGLMTGNENWSILEQQSKKAAAKAFVDQLANEETEWMSIDQSAWQKIRALNKLVKKQKD